MTNENNSMSNGAKVILIILLIIVMLFLLGLFLLARLPTVGGSFGFGFPGGSGKGSVVKNVIIDVEPQVVYRIDEHRFFTLEQYKDCTHGGFVYYHDTRKNLKRLVTSGARDTDPQNEISVDNENDIMAFKGKFIFAASDNVIAYPVRHLNYKYGGELYYIAYRDVSDPQRNSGVNIMPDTYSSIIADDAIYVKEEKKLEGYNKYNVPNRLNKYSWVDDSDFSLKISSIDDRFHCDNKVKPRSVKYY